MKSKISYTSDHELKVAVLEMAHNYVADFGFEDGIKRFASTCANHAKIAQEITVHEFNKITGADIEDDRKIKG